MGIIKIADVGQEATLTITGCEQVEGQFGPQVRFDADGETLYLPASSALNQLAHIGLAEFDSANQAVLDPSAVVGKTFRFYRTPNKKAGAKPYWNIEQATKPSGKRIPAPAPEPPSWHKDVPLPGEDGAGAEPAEDYAPLSSAKIDGLIAQKREVIEAGVRWAFGVAWTAMVEKAGEEAALSQLRAVAALAGTTFIGAAQRGAI